MFCCESLRESVIGGVFVAFVCQRRILQWTRVVFVRLEDVNVFVAALGRHELMSVPDVEVDVFYYEISEHGGHAEYADSAAGDIPADDIRQPETHQRRHDKTPGDTKVRNTNDSNDLFCKHCLWLQWPTFPITISSCLGARDSMQMTVDLGQT